MSAHAEIRDDAPGGPAARALFAEYMELVKTRLGLPDDTVPPERIFATEDVFSGRGGAWLVAFDEAGEPVGCGGLRVLSPAWARSSACSSASARAARASGGGCCASSSAARRRTG